MAIQEQREPEERHHSLERSQAKMSQMKAQVSLSLCLIILSLIQVEASRALLERLLESNLKTAACQARCAGVSSEEVADCLEICSLTETSRTKICHHERFCTGGCRAACSTEREQQPEVRSLSQQGCLLTWTVSPQSAQSSQVFLVAGLDQAGMVSLVADLVVETSLELSPALTQRFRQLTVLAVDRRGLTDTKTVTLQPVSHCPSQATLTLTSTEQSEPLQEDEVAVEKIENKSYEAALYIAVVVSLLMLTIFTVATIVCRRRRGRKSIEEANTFTASNAFLISQEDFLYDDQPNNEKYTFF